MEQKQGLKRRQENQGLVGNTYSPEVYQTKKETGLYQDSLCPNCLFLLTFPRSWPHDTCDLEPGKATGGQAHWNLSMAGEGSTLLQEQQVTSDPPTR